MASPWKLASSSSQNARPRFSSISTGRSPWSPRTAAIHTGFLLFISVVADSRTAALVSVPRSVGEGGEHDGHHMADVARYLTPGGFRVADPDGLSDPDVLLGAGPGVPRGGD